MVSRRGVFTECSSQVADNLRFRQELRVVLMPKCQRRRSRRDLPEDLQGPISFPERKYRLEQPIRGFKLCSNAL